jgi:hypothetical protein
MHNSKKKLWNNKQRINDAMVLLVLEKRYHGFVWVAAAFVLHW